MTKPSKTNLIWKLLKKIKPFKGSIMKKLVFKGEK
jgi:hypothetical protein